MRKAAVCVAGWHFPEAFHAELARIPDVTVFIVSHRPTAEIPQHVRDTVTAERLLPRTNAGYDWGCYQQFLETGYWKSFDYLFFMHDDMEIRDRGFVEAAIDQLHRGHSVIGNGLNAEKTDWPRTHLGSYAHSTWVPPSLDFQHQTVRGSFFATTHEVISRAKRFEVFWDRFRLSDQFGNWSLRATCGKLQHLFGEETFGFLSDQYRHSEFLIEGQRGEIDVTDSSAHLIENQPAWYQRFFQCSQKYMRARMDAGSRSDRLLAPLWKPVIQWLARPSHADSMTAGQIPQEGPHRSFPTR